MTLQPCVESSLAECCSQMEVLSEAELDAYALFVRVLSRGMDDGQEPDQYEERLKEVFNSFDTSGCGSLSPEELSDLCQSLHLEDATPVLLHTLLQNQDHLTARVDFDQFKNALILVLSSTLESHQAEQEASLSPESPEIQPKFVKGGKRYGRRSTPEFSEPEESGVLNLNPADEEDLEDTYDSAVPRKRERWNAHKTSTEEYEAEGQMHLWNPDEPSTPRGSAASLTARLEGQLREACDELEIAWDGSADHAELLTLCEHLGLELNGEVLLNLTGDGVMNVQEFVSRVLNHNKPPTPSASTPYRQLKRHHSTQPFDEVGRRISALPSSIGMRLFSTLDDGTGFTPVEYILDAWIDEGIENSAEILQALNFDLDGKLSLGDLTAALENELLVTKNGVHQAALASFKSEIRCLVERVDREIREKEKIQLDLERAEKQKTQLAAEVDEHHSAIEHKNNLNLRKLEQDYKEKLTAVRSELMKEMDHVQQQAGLQREELEAEMEKIREEESFLRDHLSISVKENRRLEMELLDSTEKLVEAQSQVTKLQTNLESIMKDKFGGLDPGSADFLLQEERLKQLHSSYEAQCRELQDRIDELQSELRECRTLGRAHEPCSKPLSEELESKSPGTESDPGLGSDEVQPFSMSLEAEMMLEQLKGQHFQEMEELRNQLETKISEFDKIVENQKVAHEDQKATLIIQHQQEVQTLKEEVASVQSQLEQVALEQTRLEQNQAGKRKELETQQEEVENLRQQLLEAHRHITDLEDQLITVEGQQAQTEEDRLTVMEELRTQHAVEITRLKEEQAELQARVAEEREELQDQKAELERRLLDDWEREKKVLEEFHQSDLTAQVEEAKRMFEEEREEVVKKLTNQWQEERAQLDEQNESLQVLLEEEMLKLVKEQEEKENQLKEQWESERAQLQQHHEKVTLDRIVQERLQLQEQFEQRERRLREEWERERLQLEEDYEGMIQDRLNEEKEKFETEDEERIEMLIAEERAHLEESHQEAVRKLMDRHAEERNALSTMLDKLRDDITQERKEVETSFTQRISQVEDGFSDSQESVTKRFQTNILNLEERFQSELQAFSENHAMQKLHWEAEILEALESAEEQRRTLENMEAERRELENVHSEEMEALKMENKQLQSDLDEMMSRAQGKELELRMQLNDLHSRLQEKHELLAQSESRAGRVQLLVEEFKQEREQLLSTYSHLETKYSEVLSTSEGQVVESVQLLTEREDLKVKVEELEMLLKQAAMDFELDRQELQENLSILEKRLREETDVSEMELKLLSASPEKGQDEEVKHPHLMDHAVSQYQTEVTLTGGNVDGFCEGYRGDNVVPDPVLEDRSPERGELFCRGCDHRIPDAPGTYLSAENRNGDASQEMLRESVSPLQAFVDGETRGAVEFHSVETKPQEDSGGGSHEDEPRDETVVGASGPEETGDPDECSVEDAEIKSLPDNSHDGQELVVDLDSDRENHSGGPRDCVEALNHENQEVLKLQALCNTSIDENLLLHEKVSLLQQKAEILEDLLAHNSEKVRTGRQALEENYKLKVQMLLLMEHIRQLEMKTIQTSDLQIRYEDCMCENAKLKEQNCELEQKVWSLEGRADVLHSFQSRQVSLMDDISRMREENAQLLALLGQLGGQEGSSDTEQPESPTEEVFLHPDGHLQAETFTQDCCEEFEEQNAELRRALAELQDESQALTETTQACRSTASRLAEENLLLSQNIAALKDGDLQQTRDELTQSLEDLKNEKFAAQQAADRFKQQLSELNLQSQQLEGENETLMEKNAQNSADIEGLRQQLAKLMKEMEKMAMIHTEEKKKMAVSVSGLEAELNKALKDTAQLEERNVQLSQQLSDHREKVDSTERPLRHFLEECHVDEDAAGLHQPAKARDNVKTADERVQAVNRQTAHLKSELRVLQQERDSLKLEVSVLHKQLQNANDKNHVLEQALHSSGLQNHTKKLYRDGMSRILEQEQQQLRQEKERLQAEVHKIKSDLIQSKEKVRQLEAATLALSKQKQQSHSSKVKALEQETAALKQELEAHRKLTTSCEAGRHAELEALRQQNEALNAQITRLSSQLLESFQAQFGGFLPPSPRRMQRGQHHGEDPDNMQEERERKMKNMEERMKEIELSLFNVKLLLKEKVAQLNDQLNKNGKADVLIKDLYVENSHLVKALERTEQRHEIAEKKNYLLEEKISTLNKIVRDLNPSYLPGLSYNCKYA
ncbi:ninein isoform X3 [Nothobranchius furzeri]